MIEHPPFHLGFSKWLRAVICLLGVLLPGRAEALLLQAPVGGAAITLPEERVLCGSSPIGWTIESSRRTVRPSTDGRPGQTSNIVLANSIAACATGATERATLVLTGNLPNIDASTVSVFIDGGRLEMRGDGLEGTRVAWRSGDITGSDVCLNVQKDKGRDLCAMDVDRKLPADPSRIALRWAPEGGRTDPDAITYDAAGNPQSAEQMRLPAAKVLVNRIFPLSRTVDVASGEGRIELLHPEALSSVDCGGGRCELTEAGVVVRAIPAASTTIQVKARLLPRVFLSRGDALDSVPTETLTVLRCPLAMVSGSPLRNADNLRVLLKLDTSCSKDVDQLRWTAGQDPAEVTQIERLQDGVYVMLSVGRISSDRLTVVASRPEDGSVLAVVTEKTWEAPPLRTLLTLPTFGEIDFIPKNRDALLVVFPALRTGKLVPESVPGAYTVTEHKDGFHIRGDYTSGGYTSLRFAYRVTSVPDVFLNAELATLSDPVQRPIREANVPVPLGASGLTKRPIVELLCAVEKGKVRPIEPGTSPHIPFAARDSCRLVIHRDRIPVENGEQRIDIDVSVTTVSGGDRGDAHFSQHLVLRHGPNPDVIWVRGAKEQFDRMNVRITHVIDETQYLSGVVSRTELPSAQWTVVTENASFRFYATTVIPASLYRFSKDKQDLGTGPLALNFGVLSRLTWLDSDGKEGLVGLEMGMIGMGLATDLTRQLALVTGLGVSVPLGNINQPTQASVNIHAWFSYTVGTRHADLKDSAGVPTGETIILNPWAFVFGPSITIGNVGTFL